MKDFKTASENQQKDESLLPSYEIVLEDESYSGMQDMNAELEGQKKTIGAGNLLTEDGKVKLFIAPAAMQAASRLFTYALGMNMTANRGRKPICDCGKRRIDGVYPYVERDAKNSYGDQSVRLSGHYIYLWE